ncbi:MAG: DnaJ domain-containing protein, partial [Thermoguttaceae bacterium]
MAEDYYATLGVSKTASNEDIQKAYRAKARKLHPDMNPDDPNAKKNFQQLQEAFEVLNNPEKRKMYDQFGSAYFTQGGSPQGNPFQWSGGGSPFGQHWNGRGGAQQGGAEQANFNIDDILRMFGGGGAGAAGAERGGFGDADGMGSHPFSQFFNMGGGAEGGGGTGTGRRRRASQAAEKVKGTDITHTIT